MIDVRVSRTATCVRLQLETELELKPTDSWTVDTSRSWEGSTAPPLLDRPEGANLYFN
jgi:hypothetical protein